MDESCTWEGMPCNEGLRHVQLRQAPEIPDLILRAPRHVLLRLLLNSSRRLCTVVVQRDTVRSGRDKCSRQVQLSLH